MGNEFNKQSQQNNHGNQQPQAVVPITAMQQFLANRAKVTAVELGNIKFRREDMLELPIIPDKYVTVKYAKAGERQRQMHIGDINSHLSYGYLPPESLQKNPAYMNNWFPVRKGVNEGAANIPDHYFDAEGYIVRGDSILCFTTAEYVKQMQAEDLKPAFARLMSFHGPVHMERPTGGAENAAVTQSLSISQTG